MAKAKAGPIVAVISGNVAGVNFAQSRGATIVRGVSRRGAGPTIKQEQHAALYARLSACWSSLTDTERATWSNAAANIQRTDRVGYRRPYDPRRFFFACNFPVVQIGLAPFREYYRGPQLAPLSGVTIEATSDGAVTVTASPQSVRDYRWMIVRAKRSCSTF